MTAITAEELELHAKWLRDEPDGVRLVKRGANLRGADLHGANLSGADLRGAYLHGANLSGACLLGAWLRGADLRGANLRRACLAGANLICSNLTGANLHCANLHGADLYGADLYCACLAESNLAGSNLAGANLYGADLYGADLDSSKLYGANLHCACLRGADLHGAIGLPIAADAADRLVAVAKAALQPDALEMDSWHTCGTTHCIAGWAIHLAGEPGRIMEETMGAGMAGLFLLGTEAYKHFHDSNEKARKYLESVLAAAEVK